MQRLPLAAGQYKGRSDNLSAQEIVNGFIEIEQKEEAYKVAICKRPGLKSWATVGVGEIRGMRAYNGKNYVVSGSKLYEVTTAGAPTYKGSLTTSTGPVRMTDNGLSAGGGGDQLVITDGTNGYVYDVIADTFSTITFPDSFSPDVCTFIDGYIVYNRNGTGRFYISALYDASSVSALDFATAEGDPDNLVTLINNHRELWLIGENTTEVWYNSGADFPFTRFQGGFAESGCAAKYSLAKTDTMLMWLGRSARGGVYFMRGAGARAQIASPPSVNYQLERYTTVEDAFAFSFQYEGHEFYVCTFPTEKKTWVFDIAVGEWFKWDSLDAQSKSRDWKPNCQVFFNDKNLVGGDDGKIWEIDSQTFDDDGETIRFEVVSQHTNNAEQRLIIAELQLIFEEGIGLTSGQGSDPQVIFSYSKDGGHTYGDEKLLSIGKKGEYRNRAIARKLGIGRNWTFRAVVTDPVKVILLGAAARFRNQVAQ